MRFSIHFKARGVQPSRSQDVQAALEELWGFSQFFRDGEFLRAQGVDYLDLDERHVGVNNAEDLVELLAMTVWRVNQQVCEVDFSVSRVDEHEVRLFRPRPADYGMDDKFCRLPAHADDLFKLELTRSELFSLLCTSVLYLMQSATIGTAAKVILDGARRSAESEAFALLSVKDMEKLGELLRDELGLQPADRSALTVSSR